MTVVALVSLVLAAHMVGAAAQGGPNIAAQCKAGALTQHNYMRSMHQAPPLAWNDTLASAAQAVATGLASEGCATPALSVDQSVLSVLGTDYPAFISPCTVASVVWYAGGINWTFSHTPISSNSAPDSRILNVTEFANVLWASTKQLGCATVQGTGGCWSIVCKYSVTIPAPEPTPAVEAAYFDNVKAPVISANMTPANNSCYGGVLTEYNNIRRMYNGAPKTWDAMQTIGSQSWANELAKHNCPQQNVKVPLQDDVVTWFGAPTAPLCAGLIFIAYREAAEYRFTNTPLTDNLPHYHQIGSLIHMIDKNNVKMGCGLAQGTNGCWAGVCWHGWRPLWTDQFLFDSIQLPIPAPPTPDQVQCQKAALVKLNAHRADHGVQPLTWNASFATLAQSLAVDAAAVNCDTSWLGETDGVDGYTTNGTNSEPVCSQAGDFFYSKGNTTFDLTKAPWTDNKASFDQWHTYTQMIWQDTSQVGCGSAQGKGGCQVVICKYDPIGNTQTDSAFLQNVLPIGGLPPSPQADSSPSPDLPSTSDSSHSKKIVAIAVGVCVGVGVAIAIVAGLIFWSCRRKQQQHQQQDVEQEARADVLDKPDKAALTLVVTPESNTSTEHTSSAGQPEAVMEIPGLMSGDPFSRGTAFAYSWNMYSPVRGVTQSVEAGVNDLQLDAMVQGHNGWVQDCPVVCLSKEQVREQLQLLTHGLQGRGGVALVFKALWPSRFGSDALVAVKVLKDGYNTNPYMIQSFAHEASVLQSVRHPNVVRLYGYCLDPPNVCLIMELLPCSLKDVLYGKQTAFSNHGSAQSVPGTLGSKSSNEGHNPPSKIGEDGVPLTMSQVLQVSTEIAAGLAYLHDQTEQGLKDAEGNFVPILSDAAAGVEQAVGTLHKIVHRDLKPANILINSRGQVKISDFGLARRHDSTTIDTKHMGAGTVPYQAPEILSGAQQGALGIKATNRCDVYSMAIMFWEMLARQPPWKEMNEVVILSQVLNSKRPELPGEETIYHAEDSSLDLTQLPASLTALPAYNDIIRQCWAQRDWRRPTAAEAHRLLVELQQKYQATATASASVCVVVENNK